MNIKLPVPSGITLLPVLTFFLLQPLNAQDILWEKSYGGKQADYLLDAQPTADYGFILAGGSLSVKSGNKTEDAVGDLDFWIWKMNEQGELDWQKNLGGEGSDLLSSIRNTTDGGFILAGTSDSRTGMHKKEDSHGKEDFWIIKLNAKGGEEWQKTLGGSGQDIVKVVLQSSQGGYIVGGSSSSDMSPAIKQGGTDPYGKWDKCRGSLDFWIVKLDEKGTVQWQKTIGGQYADILESLDQTSDDGYILAGYTNSPSSIDKSEEGYGVGDYWIVKLDKQGNMEWQRLLGGEEDDHVSSILQTKDGGYIIGGNSASATSGNKSRPNKNGTDFWLIRLDEKGAVVWQQTYDAGKVDILTSLVENSDGSYLLGGYAQSETIAFLKISSPLLPIARRHCSRPSPDTFIAI